MFLLIELSQPESMNDMTELRELLIASLEQNGVLSNIKSQLRAAIYNSIEQERHTNFDTTSKLQRNILESIHSRVSYALVKDYLEKIGLHYTRNVLESEASLNSIDVDPDDDIYLPDFHLPETNDQPILQGLLRDNRVVKSQIVLQNEFTEFLEKNPIASETDVLSTVQKFPPLAKYPTAVIEAYISSSSTDHSEPTETAKSVFSQILCSSTNLMSSSELFANPLLTKH